MRLFRKKPKITYPRVVEFENGKFGVEVEYDSFIGISSNHVWVSQCHVWKYASFDSEEQAILALNKLNVKIKRQVYP